MLSTKEPQGSHLSMIVLSPPAAANGDRPRLWSRLPALHLDESWQILVRATGSKNHREVNTFCDPKNP